MLAIHANFDVNIGCNWRLFFAQTFRLCRHRSRRRRLLHHPRYPCRHQSANMMHQDHQQLLVLVSHRPRAPIISFLRRSLSLIFSLYLMIVIEPAPPLQPVHYYCNAHKALFGRIPPYRPVILFDEWGHETTHMVRCTWEQHMDQLSAQWETSLTSEQKRTYEQMATDDNRRYQQQLVVYKYL
jgi:hypothetical protein